MKSYIVYNRKTGQILRSVYCTEQDSFLQAKNDDEVVLQSNAKDDEYYIENGKLIKIPVQPSINHAFDYDTKKWILSDVDKVGEQIKFKRNQLLAESDWTQMADVNLTNKQAWATYRQELRDITSQSGYPFEIIWPEIPR